MRPSVPARRAMRNPCRSPSTPARSRCGRILQIYFSVAHNPTELNYQGPDSGTQYRSTIFPTTPEQAQIAKAYIAQLDQAHVFDGAIVTTIEPGRSFYPAEGYHQNFLTLNPNYPYIVYQRSAEDRESEADVSPTSTAPTRCWSRRACRTDRHCFPLPLAGGGLPAAELTEPGRALDNTILTGISPESGRFFFCEMTRGDGL